MGLWTHEPEYDRWSLEIELCIAVLFVQQLPFCDCSPTLEDRSYSINKLPLIQSTSCDKSRKRSKRTESSSSDLIDRSFRRRHILWISYIIEYHFQWLAFERHWPSEISTIGCWAIGLDLSWVLGPKISSETWLYLNCLEVHPKGRFWGDQKLLSWDRFFYFRVSAAQEIINLSRLISGMAQKTASTVKSEVTPGKVSLQFGKANNFHVWRLFQFDRCSIEFGFQTGPAG